MNRDIPLTDVATISGVVPFQEPLKMKIYHRDTETPSLLRQGYEGRRMQMWRLFRPRKYRGQNKRHGFLKEYLEKEEIPFSSPSILPSRVVSRILVRGYSPSLKFVKHFLLGASVSLAKRVVNPLALQVAVTPLKGIPLK
jgi:hypothetical protein